MEEKFKPKVVSDVNLIAIVIKYIAEPESSMRSIARECCVSKSTVWNYVHHIRDYDYRLAELVNTKLAVVCNAATKKNFKIAKALETHLYHVVSKLEKRKTLPADISSYVWDEYITKKCNH